MDLTHVNERGEARMVDIRSKEVTDRSASAQAIVRCRRTTIDRIASNSMPKGDVFSCARIAGIMAAKKTDALIPMCHPLPLSSVVIDIKAEDTSIRIVSHVTCVHKTGAEMEALTAASVAALTIYDMCKAIDKHMVIDRVMLLSKTGGKSGPYIRPVITAIKTKQAKDTFPTAHETLEISYPGGDMGDLSLVTRDTLLAIEKADGICTKRFWANIEVSGLPGEAKEGSFLRLGGVLCKINRVGRPCHQLCDCGKAGEVCALVNEAVFLEIIQGGALCVGDEVTLETP